MATLTHVTHELTLRNVRGEQIALSDFQDPPTVLVFFTPTCDACRAMTERFRAWPNALPEGVDLQPVFVGQPSDFNSTIEFVPLVEHAWYDDGSVSSAVSANPSPAAVLIDKEHPTGDQPAYGMQQIEQLVVRPGFWQEPIAQEAAQQWKAEAGARLMESGRKADPYGVRTFSTAPKISFRNRPER